jgi:hypothetical protein
MSMFPPTFQARLYPTVTDQQLLDLWTQVVVLLVNAHRPIEKDHQTIVLNAFLVVVPGGTIKWDTEPSYRALRLLLDNFEDGEWQAAEDEDAGLPPITSSRPTRLRLGGPGRPRLSPPEIAECQKIVGAAKAGAI